MTAVRAMLLDVFDTVLHVDVDAVLEGPTSALLVDDQQGYCGGAEGVGMRAVRIARHGNASDVRSLTEVLALLGPPARDP